VIELGSGLQLARGRFDLGLMTDRPVPMLEFWCGARGLPVERTLVPAPGITQHKLTMHGAVLKVNCVEAPLARQAAMGGVRLLRLAETGIDAPVHVRDPDGSLVQLVPPNAGLRSFGVHLAVSDEDAATRFYGDVLGLEPIGDRTFDLAGADVSFAWSPDVVPTGKRGGPGFGYLTLQVMDVYEAHALLCGRGATELRSPSATAFAGGSSVSFVTDPDGNTIELSQRPDLVAAASERGLQMFSTTAERSATAILDPDCFDLLADDGEGAR
jgi:catechol 2,3-dioxygenase-like lactoylglutathione lyase family enzyme